MKGTKDMLRKERGAPSLSKSAFKKKAIQQLSFQAVVSYRLGRAGNSLYSIKLDKLSLQDKQER